VLTRPEAVLKAVQDGAGMSLHEICQQTSLAKPTLLRILRTLEADGYVRRGLTDQRYHANVRSVPTEEEVQRSVLAEVAAPILDRLCQDVLWPSDLAIHDEGYMWVQETSRRRSPFMMNRAVTQLGIHMRRAKTNSWTGICSGWSTRTRDRNAVRGKIVAAAAGRL
jgi:IclR family transcriptional regulator, mhp operon transcriptional activator